MEPPFVIEAVADAAPANEPLTKRTEDADAETEEPSEKAPKKAPEAAAKKKAIETEVVEKTNAARSVRLRASEGQQGLHSAALQRSGRNELRSSSGKPPWTRSAAPCSR